MGDEMRKLFRTIAAVPASLAMCVAANAADLTSAPAPAPPFSWTGFYIGGNIGGAWVQSDVTDTMFDLNFANGSNNGRIIFGGQAGLNYQIGNFVIGVEGEWDWSVNNNTDNGVLIPAIGNILATSNDTWISTVAARFGFAVDHWLFYGKAGAGWVGNNGFTITNTVTGESIAGSSSGTSAGWLAGAGIEWALTNNWTLKLEYDYLAVSTRSFTLPATADFLAGDTFTTTDHNFQMVKVGINYLFNWANPVVARY
jgi:outer membrane immunogenic protein